MMSKKDTNLGKNIVYMTIYHVFTALTPLIVTPYISRVLGATEIGKYTYAYSLAYYFVMLANLGITTHGSRRIAEVRHNSEAYERRVTDLFWLHIFNSVIVSVGYVIAIFLGMNQSNQILSLIMIFYVLSSVVDVKWLFYGLERFKVTVLRSIIIKIIYIALIFIFVRNRNDITTYTFIMAFVSFFIAELSLFVMIPKCAKIRRPDFHSMRLEILPLFTLFIPSVAHLLLRHFDKLMIGWMSTYDQLGMYENTDRVFLILVTVITAVGDVMMPRISNLLASDNAEKADSLLKNGLHISIIIACAFTFGIISIAKEFVPVFFGNDFMGCIELLIWIAPSIIMLTFSALVRKQYLIPRYLEKVYLTATVSSLLINIIANYIFIPHYGALGAVFGTLISEFAVIAIQFIMIHKQLNYKPFLADVVRYSFVGIVMLIVVRIISRLPMPPIYLLLIEIIIGATIFVGLSIMMMKVTNDDLLIQVKMMIERKEKKHD